MKLIDLYTDEIKTAHKFHFSGNSAFRPPKDFAQILSWRCAEEAMGEVFPLLILLFDGVDLPLPNPYLHRLFALDCELNVFKIFPPDKICDVVAR